MDELIYGKITQFKIFLLQLLPEFRIIVDKSLVPFIIFSV